MDPDLRALAVEDAPMAAEGPCGLAEEDRVAARAAVNLVRVGAAADVVVAGAAVDEIAAAPAVDVVAARVAVEAIEGIQAEDVVVAAETADGVDPVRSDQGIVPIGTGLADAVEILVVLVVSVDDSHGRSPKSRKSDTWHPHP